MGKNKNQSDKPVNALKRGWTTGACATAATKSALNALLGGEFLDPVPITLPGGQTPAFALGQQLLGPDFAQAGIVKDAGDDPDVTHGATIIAHISRAKPGTGIHFVAGTGVGTFTKPGLPYDVGEPAINPVPRQMMESEISRLCAKYSCAPDFTVTLCVPSGEEIAQKTWNPRLGIIGGISILGTTGIVVPYSCSAWIHAIHSGVNVAKAQGLTHLVGATGDLSEKAAQSLLDLPLEAYIDMGDFVGGFLKYIRKNPVPKITIAGGFAKISKLAQGAMDLHSGRSQVDKAWLCDLLEAAGAQELIMAQASAATSGNHILQIGRGADINLAQIIAKIALEQAHRILKKSDIIISIIVIDRQGEIIANTGFPFPQS